MTPDDSTSSRPSSRRFSREDFELSRPLPPDNAAGKKTSPFGIILALLFAAGCVVVLVFLSAALAMPVLGAVAFVFILFGVAAVHYLLWGWWLGGMIREDVAREEDEGNA